MKRLRLALALLLTAAFASAAEKRASTLITHVTIVDGTGAPSRQGSVRLKDDRIESVGAIEAAPDDVVYDGKGLVLAPGFIDTHSHHDQGLGKKPTADEAVSQGITTIVCGQDGGAAHPLKALWARLEKQPAAVNVTSYCGHNSIRRAVMGADFRRVAMDEGQTDGVSP